MDRGLRRTVLGLGANDFNPEVREPGDVPATRSAIIEIAAASPNPAMPDTKVVTPAQALVVPSAHFRSNTKLGMGEGDHVTQGVAVSPVRENPTIVANLETENGVHREHAKAIYQFLLTVGLNATVAYWIGGGKPVPEGHREQTLVLLRKGNVDPDTISNFEKTGCISTVPTIVPPKLRVRSGTTEINASPVVAPLAGPQVDAAGPVEIDDAYAQDPGYQAALGSVDRDRDTDPLIKVGQWKTRALIAGIVLAGLGALGYGVTQISDNLTHSVSGPRR